MLKSAFNASRLAGVSTRMLSTKVPKIYHFEDVKSLIQKPNPSKILVDVREPNEVKQHALPTAINLPLKTAPGALSLKPEEFEDVFHFKKPSTDKELIFFCAAGVRAKAAEELARSYGYENTGIYPGSMNEWLEKSGSKS